MKIFNIFIIYNLAALFVMYEFIWPCVIDEIDKKYMIDLEKSLWRETNLHVFC